MILYLLRHGIAVDPVEPGVRRDADRPLTPKGRRRLHLAARALRSMGISFDLILASPYVRSRQTAEIIVKALQLHKLLQSSEHLAPGGNPKSLIQSLNAVKPRPKSVLLVGHEPCLTRLIALLVAGNTDAIIDLKKGGLCRLGVENLCHGRCAVLESLLTPRQLECLVD